jgi:hypothetical protein
MSLEEAISGSSPVNPGGGTNSTRIDIMEPTAPPTEAILRPPTHSKRPSVCECFALCLNHVCGCVCADHCCSGPCCACLDSCCGVCGQQSRQYDYFGCCDDDGFFAPDGCDISVGILLSCVFWTVFAGLAIGCLLYAINLPTYDGELVSASVRGSNDDDGAITLVEQFMYFPDGLSHNTTFRYCTIPRAKSYATVAAAEAAAQNISVGSFRKIWLDYHEAGGCMDYPIVHANLIVGLVFLGVATLLFAIVIYFMRLQRLLVKDMRARRSARANQEDPEAPPIDESELDVGLK